MNLKKVSVIIPTYKRAHLLKRAVESVINAQGNVVKEIIIVENGDSDQAYNVFSNISSITSNDIVYYKIKEKGPSAARNFGVYKSKGEFIVFLDDDDQLSPNFFKIFEKIKITPQEPYLILLGFQFFYHVTKKIVISRKSFARSRLPSWKRPIAVGSIFTRGIFEDANIFFDPNLFHLEDIDLSIQCEMKNVKTIDFNLPVYKCHVEMPWRGGSLTKTDYERLFHDTEYFYRKHFQYYSLKGPEAVAFLYYLKGMSYAKLGKMNEARNYFKESKNLCREFKYISSYALTFFGKKGFDLGRYLYFFIEAFK